MQNSFLDRNSFKIFLSLFLIGGIYQTRTYSSQGKDTVELNCFGRQILTANTCEGDGVESEEQLLYAMVNEYRVENGLPSIPLSPSLNLVANRHVLDLDRNTTNSLHGWSDCPYDASNRSTYPCMWNAPQRLGTAYEGYGYENSYWSSGQATASEAFDTWKRSSAHNSVILNQGIWQDREWKALGIGIYGGYAVLWFGEEVDPSLIP